MSAPSFVTSADGTRIAYETAGSGPPVILIGGAFNDRRSRIAGTPMAALMADAGFSAITFDRRGRGDSGDTLPYAVEREIDDLKALAAAAGGPVALFGHSSGGALALEAAAAGLPVTAIAVYEPAFSMDDAAEAESVAFTAGLAGLIDAGSNGDAAAFFMEGIGMPAEMVAGMRQGPQWPPLEKLAPTLRYDVAVMRHGGDSFVPAARIARIDVPLLAMAGGDSPGWMADAARAIAAAAPQGTYRQVDGYGHNIPAEAVAPILRNFLG